MIAWQKKVRSWRIRRENEQRRVAEYVGKEVVSTSGSVPRAQRETGSKNSGAGRLRSRDDKSTIDRMRKAKPC